MKFGFRTPSLTKRIAARTSASRIIRHSVGIKAPKGAGWITNPKRAAYNRVYNRTTFKSDNIIALVVFGLIGGIIEAISDVFSKDESLPQIDPKDYPEGSIVCPSCSSLMNLKYGRRGKFYGCSSYPYCSETKNFPLPKSETDKNSSQPHKATP